MNKLGIALTIFLLGGLVFAQTAATSEASNRLTSTLKSICDLSAGLLGPAAFVLFVLAGVVYASGQFFGAEMRANASKWAMSMISGAVIAFLLWIIGPMIVSALSGGTVSYSIGAGACSGITS